MDIIFGITAAFSKNNYCEALFGLFQEDIDKIAEKYQVEVEVNDSYVWVINDISHMKEIGNGINAVQEIYTLIEDNIPETELYWFGFSIYLDTTNFGKAQNILNEIRFLYNIKDGMYYTPVGFGIELDTNGGVEDYLQREIFEFYYLDAVYYYWVNTDNFALLLGMSVDKVDESGVYLLLP